MTSQSARTTSVRERWTWIISLIGLLIWSGFLWNFVLELRTLSAVFPPLLAFLLGTGLSVALMYSGLRLARESWVEGHTARRIVGWGVGGLFLMSLITGLTIIIRVVEGRPVSEPQLDVLVGMSSGMLAGVLVGYLYEQATHDAERVRETRDALAFLNQTLRHECLNGLNIIRGNTELIRANLTDADLQTRAATIETRATGMSEMIQDIRLYANTFVDEADIEPINLTQVLAPRIENLRDSFPDAEVTGDVPSGVAVVGNRALGNVFENVLHNAVEHNDKATPEVTVTVETTAESVRIHVADNGPGIPEAERDQLFEPRLDRDHRFGLYLVETLVSYCDGDVEITDNDPEGTVVTIELPRADTAESA